MNGSAASTPSLAQHLQKIWPEILQSIETCSTQSWHHVFYLSGWNWSGWVQCSSLLWIAIKGTMTLIPSEIVKSPYATVFVHVLSNLQSAFCFAEETLQSVFVAVSKTEQLGCRAWKPTNSEPIGAEGTGEEFLPTLRTGRASDSVCCSI